MEKEIIDSIVKGIKNKENNGSKIVYKDFEAVELSKDNFRSIKDSAFKGKIAFIDGGNAEIIGGSSFSLQLIRVFYVIYQNNKRIKTKRKEFYVLVTSKSENNKIFYSTKFFGEGIKENIIIDSLDENIRQGKNRAEVSFIGGIIRRFSEIEFAEDAINELDKGDIIVMDGTLESKYNNEEEKIDDLFQKCSKNGIMLSAVAKTCDLFTDSGKSIISVLNSFENKEKWIYYPLIISNKKDIAFVKLHKKSNYVFRLDFFKEDESHIGVLTSALSFCSTDPVFIGYPYGLIEADKFARIPNKEVDMIKTKFMIKSGKDWELIKSLMSEKDSHKILDNIG